jgi:hypothetical protein
MKAEARSQNRALIGALSHIQILIAKYFEIYARAKQSQKFTESSDSQAESDYSSHISVEARPSPEQNYLQNRESEIDNEIGVGLQRERGICYLIAAIQLFYHIKEIRTRRGSITHRADQAIHLTDLIRHMNTDRHQVVNCAQSLFALNLQLGLRQNEDLEETVKKIIDLLDYPN